MPVTNAPVLVTGATGFIGAELTRQLLASGYRVRGTTRDVTRAKAEGHLAAIDGADERLELVEADLLDTGAYDKAIADCECVIHVASPYVLNVKDVQRDLVDPAVNGTLSVLRSSSRSDDVKRVILTSSFAAIAGTSNGRVFTEADWNDAARLDYATYYYSKTMAERAAWGYMDRDRPGFDLVVINPAWVIGPSLIPSVNASHSIFVGAANGSQPGILAFDHPFVDVRDVAVAHIRAIETPEASGRYLTAAGNTTHRRIVEIGRELGLDAKYRFPKLSLDSGFGARLASFAGRFQPKGTRDFLAITMGHTLTADNSKVRRELRIEFRDLNETIKDTWLDLERWGHLGRR